MSNSLFKYKFNLNSTATQTAALANIAAAGKKEYEPISHFFVDETKLAAIDTTNYIDDAFGPVTGSLTTKYRTTSVIRAVRTGPVKVFAICDGQVLLQPNYDSAGAIDNTKLNIVLKPSASYNPLKIKYFIYRGVRKEDLIDIDDKLKVESNDVNQPAFLSKLWFQFISFYTDADNTAPIVFPASLIGFDSSIIDTTLIDQAFTKKDTGKTYQLPLCSAGEHIANFTANIGLDIVLDYGDYHLENQEELFKLDLKYARKNQHIFDTSTITGAVKIKRFKEHIHQFMDAAAFWGSHIECGSIELSDASKIKTNTDIFTKIVNKYQTQNKIYLYVQGENNRSYNYFDTNRKVFGFNPAGQLNETSGWPIVIEEITLATATTTFKEGKNIQLEFSVNTSINQEERHVAIDAIVPNNDTSKYPLLIKPKNPAVVPAILIDKTTLTTILLPINGVKSCASFIFLFANIKQEFPLKNYYNDLFPVNFNTNFLLPTTNTENLSSWATYDKSRLVNLDDVIDTAAIIQNKLVFDNGKPQVLVGPNLPTKKRRLYMAILKRNAIHNTEYDGLNIDTITAGIATSTTTKEQYALNVYNDQEFSVYKGTFTDPVLATTVNSLSLLHENSLVKKNSFFHLGITDEEFNKLVYGQVTIPAIVLPATTPAQYLPVDADNVFFHLEEVLPFANQNVQKFKLGFRFEDATGAITTLFPLPANNVFVYTIDGLYFFSKEYSEFQGFFEEYPKAKADFRVKQPYDGEFGFDWMRIGDTGAPGDIDYKNHVGKLYRDVAHTIIETDSNVDNGNFNPIPKMYKKLEREYNVFPCQWEINNNVDKYFIPTLTLYPPYTVPAAPSPDLDRQTIFTPPYNDDINRVARLNLKIKVVIEPIRVELKYDATILDITSLAMPIVIPKTMGNHDVDITVKCLKEFATEQFVEVIAFYNASSTKAKTIGILKVKPNAKSLRRTKKLLLINVNSNISGTIPKPQLNFTIEDQAKILKKFLRQTLSTPIMESLIIDLVLNPDATFNNDFVDTSLAGLKSLKDQDNAGKFIIEYLYDYLTTTGPAPVGTVKYANHFKVFFFNDNGQPGRFGFSLPSLNLLADFTNNLPSTTTHEFLHTANVQHTFANYEGSEYAQFTYNPLFTDNIMDYSDFGAIPPIPTISIFDWQSEVAKEKFDPEP